MIVALRSEQRQPKVRVHVPSLVTATLGLLTSDTGARNQHRRAEHEIPVCRTEVKSPKTHSGRVNVTQREPACDEF